MPHGTAMEDPTGRCISLLGSGVAAAVPDCKCRMDETESEPAFGGGGAVICSRLGRTALRLEEVT